MALILHELRGWVVTLKNGTLLDGVVSIVCGCDGSVPYVEIEAFHMFGNPSISSRIPREGSIIMWAEMQKPTGEHGPPGWRVFHVTFSRSVWLPFAPNGKEPVFTERVRLTGAAFDSHKDMASEHLPAPLKQAIQAHMDEGR